MADGVNHSDALRLSTERAREREEANTDQVTDVQEYMRNLDLCGELTRDEWGDEVVCVRVAPCDVHAEPSPDPDHLLRELVREVARRSALAMTEAVAELSGLHHRDVPRASTDALADEIHATLESDPDSPLARVRERMR